MASISKQPAGGTAGNPDDAILKAAVLDAVRLCERRYIPRFIGFLDERQRGIAQSVLRREQARNAVFFGGYPEAERTFLGVFPEGEEPQKVSFPITALAFHYRTEKTLGHRDFLGTLLSCGVKREKIGDILCSDGFAVAFAETDIARFLKDQITKVGGESVDVQTDYQGELPFSHTFIDIHDTVASPRLDAVVKLAAGISREEAARRVEAGQVSVNHVACVSVSQMVKEKDILSVRGVGRFIVKELGPVSRKGRLFITIQKYQ